MALTAVVWANRAQGLLASSITNSQTTITVSSGQGALFPSPTTGEFFPLVLQSASNATTYEIAYCTLRSSDTLTVQRGQEGTTAQAFGFDDLVLLEPTRDTINFRSVGIQVYNTPGTYTFVAPSPVLYIEVWGGGGGGSSNAATGFGGAGGAGSYGYKQMAVTPGQTFTVFIAPIASGGPAGGNGNGTNGGACSFGSLSAPGGQGGLANSGGGTSGGGIPSGFDLAIAGGGSSGENFAGTVPIGKGGDSPRGGSGGLTSITGGFSGLWPGGGGGAGMSTSAANAGGSGAAGGVVIRW